MNEPSIATIRIASCIFAQGPVVSSTDRETTVRNGSRTHTAPLVNPVQEARP
jgi:hypothetical protein